MGRKNRKGQTRNMGRGKQIRTTLANDVLIQQNAVEDTKQDVNPQDTEQMDKAICETIGITEEQLEGLADQTIEIIPLDRMFLETYQRPLNPQKVKKIAKEFDPSKLGVLMVSERPDGRYAIIDGQHRSTVLRGLGYKYARCQVVHGWTIQEEAMAFTHQHDNTSRLTAKDRFKSGVIAEEKEKTEINYIATKNGYNADGCGRGTRIEAVGTLEKIGSMYGIDVLDRVLQVTGLTWPKNRKAVCREMLIALAELLSRFDLPEADFQSRLGRYTPDGLVKMIRNLISPNGYIRGEMGKQERFCACRVLVDAYNKGLGSTSKKRLRLVWNDGETE